MLLTPFSWLHCDAIIIIVTYDYLCSFARFAAKRVIDIFHWHAARLFAAGRCGRRSRVHVNNKSGRM